MDIGATPSIREGVTSVSPASGQEHLGTVVFGLWMTIGLFLDGYFHQHLEGDGESFLTPWHAVFYSGFLGSAWWLVAMARRRSHRPVDWRLSTLPPGYSQARFGLLLFAAGGVGDAVWHTMFGVERGIDALLGPTHLLLFAGLMLLLTSPLRAAHAAPDAPPSRWMVAGSVISATALIGFFANFMWGLGIASFTRVAYHPLTGAGETAVIAGVASTVVTTVVLFAAVRVLLTAGRCPPGAVALLFGAVALLVSAAFDEDIEGVAAAVLAGGVLELAIKSRRWPLTACFAGAALVLWLVYLGLLGALDGMEWHAEIWAGAAVLNALVALAVAKVTPTFGSPRVQRVAP